MDLLKWMKSQNFTEKEMSEEAFKTLDIFSKPLLTNEDHERFMNMKDLAMRNLKIIGAIQDDTSAHAYLILVTKLGLENYWKQIELPNNQRDIYKFGCTDKQLKAKQNKYLKHLQKKLQNYEVVVAEWWEQRADELELLNTLKPRQKKLKKLNGVKNVH